MWVRLPGWRVVGAALGVVAGAATLAGCQLASPTATALASSSQQSLAGQLVTLTATVSSVPAGSSPPGSVTFADEVSAGSITLGTSPLVNGSATLSTASLTPGTHHITATYGGGSGWAWSIATVAVAVQAPATQYDVSMGDSLATGVGAPAGQGYVDDLLTHEQSRLPGLVAARFGCGGATTTTVLKGGGGCTYPEGSQLAAAEAFLRANPGRVAFVTINIGANDITGCFSGGAINTACAQTATGVIQANLTAILGGLRAAGGSVPIIGMNYYDSFLGAWITGGQSFAQSSEQFVVSANTTLQSIDAAADATAADVQTAFDTTNFALTGSYLGVTQPQNVANVCNWTAACQSNLTNNHPNATGYQVIAGAYEGSWWPSGAPRCVAPICTNLLHPQALGQQREMWVRVHGGLASELTAVAPLPCAQEQAQEDSRRRPRQAAARVVLRETWSSSPVAPAQLRFGSCGPALGWGLWRSQLREPSPSRVRAAPTTRLRSLAIRCPLKRSPTTPRSSTR